MSALTSPALASSSSSYCSSSLSSSESSSVMESTREEVVKMSSVLVAREERAKAEMEADNSLHNNLKSYNGHHSSSVFEYHKKKSSIVNSGATEESETLNDVQHPHNSLEEERRQYKEEQQWKEEKQNGKLDTPVHKHQFSVHSNNNINNNSREHWNREWASSTMDPIPTLPPPPTESSMSTKLQLECEQLRRHYLNKVDNALNKKEMNNNNAWSMESKYSKCKTIIPTVMELQDDFDALSGEVSRVMESARPPTAPSTFLSYCKSERITPTEINEKELNEDVKKEINYTFCNGRNDKNKKQRKGSTIDNSESTTKITPVDDVHQTRYAVKDEIVQNGKCKQEMKGKGTRINNDNLVISTDTTTDADVIDDNVNTLSTIKEDQYMSSMNAFTIHHVENTKLGNTPEAEQLHFLSSSSSLASLQLVEEEEEEEEEEYKEKGKWEVEECEMEKNKQLKPKVKLTPIHNNDNVNLTSAQTTPKVKITHEVQRGLGARSADIHSPRIISINSNHKLLTPIYRANINNENNLTCNITKKNNCGNSDGSTSPILSPSKLLVNRLSRANAAPAIVASSLETALQSLQQQQQQEEHKEQRESEKWESQSSWKKQQEELLLHENYLSMNGNEHKTRWDVPLSHSARMHNVNTIYNTFLTETDIVKTVPPSDSSHFTSTSQEREETKAVNEKLKTKKGKDEKNKQAAIREIEYLQSWELQLPQIQEQMKKEMEHDDIVKHLKLIKRDRVYEDNVITPTHNTDNVENRYNENKYTQPSSGEHEQHHNFKSKKQNEEIDFELQQEEYDQLEGEETKMHSDNITTYKQERKEKKNDLVSSSEYNIVNDKFKTKEENEEKGLMQGTMENKLIPPLPFSKLHALHTTPTSYTSSRVEEQQKITIITSSDKSKSKGTKLLSLSPSPTLTEPEQTPLLSSELTSLQSSPVTSRVALTSRKTTNNNDNNYKNKESVKMRCVSNTSSKRRRVQKNKSVNNEMKTPSEKCSETRDGRIKVIIRKRPLNSEEQINGSTDCVRVHDSCQSIQLSLVKQRVDLTEYTENTNFTFDHVFDEHATNVDIHNTCVKELLQIVLDGGRASCFAYGQTGSGKTYTMMGEPNSQYIIVNSDNNKYTTNESDSTKDGLYLLGARELFAQLAPFQYLCVAFYEIYCNSCFDLLNERQPIVVREDASHKINICHLTWHTLRSMDHLIQLVSVGLEQRRSGSTSANERSSRSHAILSIRVMKQNKSKNNKNYKNKQKKTKENLMEQIQLEEDKVSVLTSYEYVNCSNNTESEKNQNKIINDDDINKERNNEVEEGQREEYDEDEDEDEGGVINYVDLAGSERAADTYNEDKTTRKEGAEINKSLLALKECIRALDEKRRHVPFRGCKLTEVLRDSFIGNSRTIMIATISPSAQNYEHSANTLRYAFRVQGLTLANVSPSRARNAPRLTPRNIPYYNNKNKYKEMKEDWNKERNTNSPISTDTDNKAMALCIERKTNSPARLVRRCKSKAQRDNTNNECKGVSEHSSQIMALISSPLEAAELNKKNKNKLLEEEFLERRQRERPRWNRPNRCISQPIRVIGDLRVNSTSSSTENVISVSKNSTDKGKKEKLQKSSNDKRNYLNRNNDKNIDTTHTNSINGSRDRNNNVITISSSSLEQNGKLHDPWYNERNSNNNNSGLSPSQVVMLELLSDQSELYSVSHGANVELSDEQEQYVQQGRNRSKNWSDYHNNSNGAKMINENTKNDIKCKTNNNIIVEQLEQQLRSSIMQQVQRDLSNEIQHVLNERDALIASLQEENKELKKRISELEKITTFSTHDMLTNTLPPSSPSSSFYAHKVNEGKTNLTDNKYNEKISKQNVTNQNNYYNYDDDDDDDDFFYYEDDDNLEYNQEKCNSSTVKYKTNTFTKSYNDNTSNNDTKERKVEQTNMKPTQTQK